MKKFGLDKKKHAEIARALYEAEKTVKPIPLLTPSYPEITQEDAYAIQQEGLKLRLADGAVVVGRKIGITSRGMMEKLNVDTPDYGYLLDSMLIPEGTPCVRKELNKPMIEGEIAFIMGKDLNKESITLADIMLATAWVVPCFEVCDARFPEWKVTVRDTISDNAAAARYMIGSAPKRLSEIDPAHIGMTMLKNGALCGSAAGVEVMGSPVNSVMWLATKLKQYGSYLKKGDIVLSGAFMAADAAEAGDIYSVTLDGFPTLTIQFI